MDANSKKTGFLALMSDADLAALTDGARRVPIVKGKPVILQGAFNANLYIVESGLLHVRRKAQGHEVMLGRLEAGSFFGEMSLFDPGPTSAEVVGMLPGTMIEVSRERLDAFMDANPKAARVMLTGILVEMARRLRTADERLADAAHWAGLLQ